MPPPPNYLSRVREALLAAFLADAAGMPIQWVFGENEVRQWTRHDAADVLFFPHLANEFCYPEEYPGHYEVGQASPYGEEGRALLQFLAEDKPMHDLTDGDTWAAYLQEWARTCGGHMNECTLKFLQHREAGLHYPECGSEDGDQPNCVIKGVIVGAVFAALPQADMLERVNVAILAHQNNPTALKYGRAAAIMTQRVVLSEELTFIGGELDDDTVMWLDLASDYRGQELAVFIKQGLAPKITLPDSIEKRHTWEYLTSSNLPQAFAIPLAAMVSSYKMPTQTRDNFYIEGMRRNAYIGGDVCARGFFLGALLAGTVGKPPRSLMNQWTERPMMEALINSVLAYL